MQRSATIVAAFFVLLTALPATAQEVAGDEFVFFVEGINPRVPNATAVKEADPDATGNSILRFGGGNYANPALTWPAATGIDFSANRVRRDTLFMRLRMGADTGTPTMHGNINFMMLDTEALNGNGNPNDDDVAFRAIWHVPDSLYDNRWHDLVIALPPATVAGLDSAKVGKNLDGTPLATPYDAYALNWQYQGGYNSDGGAFITPGTDAFREFTWSGVISVGFFWDQGSGPAGNVYVDDFYIGSKNTDLSAYAAGSQPYAGTLTTTENGNSTVTVSFTPQENVGGYRLYILENEGVGVDDPERAQFVRSFGANATDLSLVYRMSSPHPSVPSPSVTFAVTAVGTSGVENKTATYSTVKVTGARPQGYVFQMSPAEVDGLFDAFSNRTISTDFLDLTGVTPFRLGPGYGTTDPADGFETPGDFDATVYVGYAPDPENADETIIMFYADVNDDALVFDTDNGSGAPSSGEPYLFDRFAFFFGTYRVTFPIGSTHGSMGAGDHASNFQPLNTAEGGIIVGAGDYASDLFSAPIYEAKPDGKGYRLMAAFLMSEIGDDVTFEAPGNDEIAYYPLIIGYDEQDGAGGFSTRATGVTSEKANVNFTAPGWYANPMQWPAVAFAGADVTGTAAEGAGAASAFALGGSAPNPVRGTARVGFSLDTAGPVEMDVYNVLGQRVARLVAGAVYAAGDHTVALDARGLAAGLYVIRLEAGGRAATHPIVVVQYPGPGGGGGQVPLPPPPPFYSCSHDDVCCIPKRPAGRRRPAGAFADAVRLRSGANRRQAGRHRNRSRHERPAPRRQRPHRRHRAGHGHGQRRLLQRAQPQAGHLHRRVPLRGLPRGALRGGADRPRQNHDD